MKKKRKWTRAFSHHLLFRCRSLLTAVEQHGDGGGLSSLWSSISEQPQDVYPRADINNPWSPVEGGVSNEVFLTRTGRINVDTRGSFLTVLELK